MLCADMLLPTAPASAAAVKIVTRTINWPAGPCRGIAITAYRALVERVAEPTLLVRSLLLTPHLVVRESCGAYLSRKEK